MDTKSSGYGSLSSMGMDLISDNNLRSEIREFYTYTAPAWLTPIYHTFGNSGYAIMKKEDEEANQ